MIVAADQSGFIMCSGNAGNGNNEERNSCGIAMSHAYSLISPFTLIDNTGTEHIVLMY